MPRLLAVTSVRLMMMSILLAGLPDQRSGDSVGFGAYGAKDCSQKTVMFVFDFAGRAVGEGRREWVEALTNAGK